MFQETTTRNHNSQSPKQTRQSRKENKKVQNCLRNSITISSPLIASGIVPETFTLSPKSGPQENQVPPLHLFNHPTTTRNRRKGENTGAWAMKTCLRLPPRQPSPKEDSLAGMSRVANPLTIIYR